MHTAEQLDRSMFSVRIVGQKADRSDVFPDWMATDRLGVVVWQPFGAVGASHLIQLAITCFYDLRPERRGPNGVYPEIYLFHVGGRHGDHSPYDFWPARKEVFVDADPRDVLDQINDKGITRLAVPDGSAVPATHRPKERETALDRIISAFAYSPTGQTPGGESRHRRAGKADGDERPKHVPAGPAACASGCVLARKLQGERSRVQHSAARQDERGSGRRAGQGASPSEQDSQRWPCQRVLQAYRCRPRGRHARPNR